jgi:hypothetical protein
MICLNTSCLWAGMHPNKESAFGADLAVRRSENLITLCDVHGIDFVTAAEQIQMAIHNNPIRPISRHLPMRRKSRFEIPKRDGSRCLLTSPRSDTSS